MDLQMNGKTALVTGGSAGIGKAIAFALAREGVDVAICARRKQPLEAAASQIARETNRKIVPIAADLTKPADAEAFVKDAHTALGRIDILVNNAGSAPGGVLDFLTEEHWAQSLQLKFMGYVRCLNGASHCRKAQVIDPIWLLNFAAERYWVQNAMALILAIVYLRSWFRRYGILLLSRPQHVGVPSTWLPGWPFPMWKSLLINDLKKSPKGKLRLEI